MRDFGFTLLFFGMVLAICAVAARLGEIVQRLDQLMGVLAK